MISFIVEKELVSASGAFWLQVSGTIRPGSFLTLYGPSGAGKTSTLRMLSGLLTPDQGRITVDGVDWYHPKQKINLKVQKRKVGFVFQQYALFPNLTVLGNLKYALDSQESASILDEVIQIMELEGLVDRYPEALSGGQQQRVALARSLVQQPKLLLLDEPLSALDHAMRSRLQDYILKAHRQYGLTTVLVSHNIGEVIKLSDEVWVMNHGQVVKKGPPSILFESHSIEGKFQFTGILVSIEKVDVVYILSVLINNEIIKVACSPTAAKGLGPGDQVMVASKAFNPIIRKVE